MENRSPGSGFSSGGLVSLSDRYQHDVLDNFSPLCSVQPPAPLTATCDVTRRPWSERWLVGSSTVRYRYRYLYHDTSPLRRLFSCWHQTWWCHVFMFLYHTNDYSQFINNPFDNINNYIHIYFLFLSCSIVFLAAYTHVYMFLILLTVFHCFLFIVFILFSLFSTFLGIANVMSLDITRCFIRTNVDSLLDACIYTVKQYKYISM